MRSITLNDGDHAVTTVNLDAPGIRVDDIIDALQATIAADVHYIDAVDAQRERYTDAAMVIAQAVRRGISLTDIIARVQDLGLKSEGVQVRGKDISLPSMTSKTTISHVALAGEAFARGGRIVLGSEDMHPSVMLSLIQASCRQGMLGVRAVRDIVTTAEDTHDAYVSLKAALKRHQDDAKAEQAEQAAPEAEAAPAPEAVTNVTTDADLVGPLLALIAGWKNDGTASLSAVVDALAAKVAAGAKIDVPA